jgi:hypothetical protein
MASLVLIYRTTVFFGKATTVNTAPIALENSYLFASPLQAKADNLEMIRVTVFLLDGRGLGVANQTVTLIVPTAVNIKDINAISDDTGKAVFDLSTSVPNQYSISAKVGSKELPQKARVRFY